MQKSRYYLADEGGNAAPLIRMAQRRACEAPQITLVPQSTICAGREYRVVSWLNRKRRLLAGFGARP